MFLYKYEHITKKLLEIMEWEIRNWLLVPMNYVSTLSLLQYQTVYYLSKIQLIPIIHLNHNSLLIYESSFASKKWSF